MLRESGGVSRVTLADGTKVAADVVVDAAGPWPGGSTSSPALGVSSQCGYARCVRRSTTSPAPPSHAFGGSVVADIDLGTYMRGDGVVDMAAFSRLRDANVASTGTVMG